MTKSFFVTGTDTDCGKTYVSCELINTIKQAGKSVIGLKPVGAGSNEQGFNDDALLLKQASNVEIDYHHINPFNYRAPVSPNIASQWENDTLTGSKIMDKLEPLLHNGYDYAVIEGAGGVCVPLNHVETWMDFIQGMHLPVVFVVGVKLGGLNHALLTEAFLYSKGVNVIGWIANQIDPKMQAYHENIMTLNQHLNSPMLAEVPFGQALQASDDLFEQLELG